MKEKLYWAPYTQSPNPRTNHIMKEDGRTLCGIPDLEKKKEFEGFEGKPALGSICGRCRQIYEMKKGDREVPGDLK